LHPSHWDSGGNLEPMPFLCCSFELNRRSQSQIAGKKQQSQSQTRKQKKRKQKAARGVCQLSFEKASPHITCSRFCTSLWREYLHVSSRSRHLVFRIFSTVCKIFLRFCQCPRHRFQDLSTLLAVSKASMIPYCKASISKKAIHRWVRVEVGWSVFLSSYRFESHTSTRGAAEEDRKEESCSWRRSGSGLWGMHERSKIRAIAVSIRTTLVISWRKPDRNAQGSLIMWEATVSNRESQSLDLVKQGMNPGDRPIWWKRCSNRCERRRVPHQLQMTAYELQSNPNPTYAATRLCAYVAESLSCVPEDLRCCGWPRCWIRTEYNNRSIFSSLNSQTILESLLPSLKFQSFFWSILWRS
jgi:hypothetical protein